MWSKESSKEKFEEKHKTASNQGDLRFIAMC